MIPKINASVLGNGYSVRKPIYQPNQEKLNLNYQGICLNTNNYQEEKEEIVKCSPFIDKLIAQFDHN